MFCYQCEQTVRSKRGNGCNKVQGICGKDEQTADLQDILIYTVKGIAQYACRARRLGYSDPKVDAWMLRALFTTLTNVNFDATYFKALIREALHMLDHMKWSYARVAQAQGVTPEEPQGADLFNLADNDEFFPILASKAAIIKDKEQVGDDIVGLRAMILYGLKGAAAYAHHAYALGYENEEIYAQFETMLDYLASNPVDSAELLDRALQVGQLNFKILELLDAANTGNFGSPEPTVVRTTPVPGKAILVSGHDLKDLLLLLEQTAGKGIHVYTHGEMLPAHAYPKLHVYPHLIGNYGGAWQNQQHEFAHFPGAILMTSNCLIEPVPTYKGRIFTTGPVGFSGVTHIGNKDFTPVIEAALSMPGFYNQVAERTMTIGFGRQSVMNVANQMIGAIKSGTIRHLFLIGGCDGAAPGRNYYSELATLVPQDSIILTLGCNKYRFNNHDFGTIAGIPRLLDMGQCNDSYSAIFVAKALADAFSCDINSLPLSLMVSWFEQKAVAVLLTLLSLGMRDIRLGPSLPAFLTPTLLKQLATRFGLKPITSAKADIIAALEKAA